MPQGYYCWYRWAIFSNAVSRYYSPLLLLSCIVAGIQSTKFPGVADSQYADRHLFYRTSADRSIRASLAAEHKRGEVIGSIMAGLLVGILASRSLSGAVGSFTDGGRCT